MEIFRSFLKVTTPLGHVTNFHFLFKDGAKEGSRFRSTTKGQTQVSGRLPDLLIPGLVLQDGKIFFQGSVRLAPLQVLFRFFQPF